MRRIGFFVFPHFQLLDITGPLAVFQVCNGLLNQAQYSLHVVSLYGGSMSSTAGINIFTDRAAGLAFDTLMISGGAGSQEISNDTQHATLMRSLAASTRRVASVCTGAFLLAGAGLLDGRRATTHWRYANVLQKDYPKVRVEADAIFIQDGHIWSSAGVTSGIDLALALVEQDQGPDLSRAVAREMVVYHRRQGGQTQFSAMLQLEASSDRIQKTLAYAAEHLSNDLSVSVLAQVAALSERQFGRSFRAETGETPARAVERLRAEAARVRLEGGRESIETVARTVGFNDPEIMRRAFIRLFGHPPQALRRAARDKR
nr:GlxA family transcriptional regulator [Pseudomonas sp. NFR09]